ncbi:alpha/beta hydrolase [Arthrobacter nitrophenolicus]|uniref:Phospholipase/carboxylesterase n=2 Tax=Arthrobacter nitrophenolicus TaxID=683150 RepID=A0ACC6TH76_9MICC|nr:phospholipase/carboxylesterase [Arthrobacter nitrophenolicus]ELT42691.1 phospholipase/carboxylesterase [Arthrobacter nitrophenolicus]
METVVWSKPEDQRAGTPLLVMMHGYGTDESRMVRLFDYLPPEFTCAALRAPMPIGDHYGWFLLDYFLVNDFADVISATNAVHGWVNAVRGQHTSVSLMGYSQGMAMASTLLRLHPQAYASVVGLSGFVLNNELLALTDSFDPKPPFFWGRDKADLVINDDATAYTADWLEKNTLLTSRTYPGMGHAMSKAEMVDVSAFLRHYILR